MDHSASNLSTSPSIVPLNNLPSSSSSRSIPPGPPLSFDAAVSAAAVESRARHESLVGLPHKRGWRETFHAHFPDDSTRIALFLSVIVSLVISALWLWFILNTRWLEQQRNPTTIVSRERLPTIQAMQALIFNFPPEQYANDGSNLLFQYVDANQQTYNGSTHIDSSLFQCPELQFYNYDLLCQPFIDGNAVFPSTLVAAPQYSFDDWPVVYRDRGDTLTLALHTIVNITAMRGNKTEMEFKLPYVNVFLMTGKQLVTIKDALVRAAPGIPSYDDFINILRGVPRGVWLKLQNVYELSLTITKTVDVNGNIDYDYLMRPSDPLPLSVDQMEQYWSYLISHQTPAEAARLTALRATPGLEYYPVLVQLAPSSFDVTTVTLKSMYGILYFISDLGGFLNLMALAFAILFPFSYSLIRPKSFVVSKMFRALCGSDTKSMNEKWESEQHKERQLEREHEMQQQQQLQAIAQKDTLQVESFDSEDAAAEPSRKDEDHAYPTDRTQL